MSTVFDMNQWTTQLRKGIAELAVLAVICRGETYGYRVVEELRQLAGLDLSESTVYPLLARLAKESLLAVKTGVANRTAATVLSADFRWPRALARYEQRVGERLTQ